LQELDLRQELVKTTPEGSKP